MVHAALDFHELDSEIDSEGHLIIIDCRIGNLTCILACVYIPPPFVATVLRLLTSYLDGRPEVPLLIIGDFNCCSNLALDRHPVSQSSALSRGTTGEVDARGGLGGYLAAPQPIYQAIFMFF